ncbi:MAG: ATP-binding protein [Elainellaceae cyanobacterium]
MSAAQFLLLEDDPVDRELIQTALMESGVVQRFISVADRQAYIDALETETVDLILSDYVLPNFDGLEALKLAKSICPEVPFILVSGVLGEEQAIDALKQGADDYVLKQRMQRLVPAVGRALQESQERQARRTVERALQKTDNLLRAIVSASPTGIITLSSEQQVMTWNKAAEQLYGWPASQITGRALPVIPEQEQADFDWCFMQALKNQAVLNQEEHHLMRDRRLIDVSLSLAPLQDGDDHIYGVVMTVTDITERKQIEAERQRNEAKLKQQTQALAAANELLLQAKQDLQHHNQDLKQFASAISHDLKAPLRGINNLSTWIAEDYGDQVPPEAKKQLGLLRQRAGRMTVLVDGLLELAKVGQAQAPLEPVDLNQMLANVIDMLAPSAAVMVNLPPNLPTIQARPLSLQRVFTNLIGNAIKHNYRPNGTVTISVTEQPQGYEFSVADDGPGIAPENHGRIFDIFQTLKSEGDASEVGARDRGENTGLGLALVKRIVESEGGQIWVDSQLGCGATFRFTWPLRASVPV